MILIETQSLSLKYACIFSYQRFEFGMMRSTHVVALGFQHSCCTSNILNENSPNDTNKDNKQTYKTLLVSEK